MKRDHLLGMSDHPALKDDGSSCSVMLRYPLGAPARSWKDVEEKFETSKHRAMLKFEYAQHRVYKQPNGVEVLIDEADCRQVKQKTVFVEVKDIKIDVKLDAKLVSEAVETSLKNAAEEFVRRYGRFVRSEL